MSKVCRHVIDRRVRRKLLNGSVLSVSWITSTGLPLPLLRAAASGSEKGFPSYTQEKKNARSTQKKGDGRRCSGRRRRIDGRARPSPRGWPVRRVGRRSPGAARGDIGRCAVSLSGAPLTARISDPAPRQYPGTRC